MLILGFILFGMLVGAAAQLILGRERGGIDWSMAIVAGLAGSFIGGLLSTCSPQTASNCIPAAATDRWSARSCSVRRERC